ncbi:MAG TPA: hypothetical protein VNV86_12555 [Candidatus Acidoferrum sp.]|nr:hypothetical protein [Candidatus Acidoferrum sp.]
MAEPGVESIEKAELVVGLVPASQNAEVIERGIAPILKLIPPAPAVLIHPPYTSSGTEAIQDTQWRLIADPDLAPDRTAVPRSLGESAHTIFDRARALGARACAIIVSEPLVATADWPALLLQLVVEEGFDLVAPCYALHQFDGMINRAFAYPLTRALYGKRIRNPLGPDFGVSGALLERMAAGNHARSNPLASLTSEAVTSGMKVCQAHLGERVSGATDWSNLSSLLVQVLGPLFLDVERNAAHWQRARASEPVPEYGERKFLAAPGSPVDVTRLIESFRLGARNLPEIWGTILPPSTLVELGRLTRQEGTAFRMPDETWARVVYDFALAHRLRTISRDQMLRAITPIYLGWLASYALEVEGARPEMVERKLEGLCAAYENTKPYFVSRWRWPDRFNP